jgi:hypothetical protein
MTRGVLTLLLVAAVAACASTPVLQATDSIDWGAAADEGVPQIVTVDSDGDTRVTKLWLVVVDGSGYIRTGGSRWFANIERDPDVVLRLRGTDYPLRAKSVLDADLRDRINEAFRVKYGFQDRFIGWFSSRDQANILSLVAREAQ